MRAVTRCDPEMFCIHRTSSMASSVLEELRAAYDSIESHAAEIAMRQFKQTQQDHDDFTTAMSWFVTLNKPGEHPNGVRLRVSNKRLDHFSPAQAVLWLRTMPAPLSYAEIGMELGWKGHQRARQVYQSAIDKAWRVANGLVRSRDYVAEVQMVNRLKRRQAA